VAYTGPQRDSAAVCSVPNTERLEQMLDEAGFALLVLTAESERTDGVVLARQNVVHEAGLFQASVPAARQLSEGGCWRGGTP
jgi:predicted nucleotide-binding protein